MVWSSNPGSDLVVVNVGKVVVMKGRGVERGRRLQVTSEEKVMMHRSMQMLMDLVAIMMAVFPKDLVVEKSLGVLKCGEERGQMRLPL